MRTCLKVYKSLIILMYDEIENNFDIFLSADGNIYICGARDGPTRDVFTWKSVKSPCPFNSIFVNLEICFDFQTFEFPALFSRKKPIYSPRGLLLARGSISR